MLLNSELKQTHSNYLVIISLKQELGDLGCVMMKRSGRCCIIARKADSKAAGFSSSSIWDIPPLQKKKHSE